ncbi:MAG: GAF domain-containing protein [Anaerolineales bacterium]|nr:GAF domain-containing protein [Anaerolineales bacterium]
MLRLGETPARDLLPIEQEALRLGESLLIVDHEQDPSHLPAHEGVRSTLVTPIAYQQSKAGLIHLHSYLPGRFDRFSVEIAKSLSIQAAIAIGNARRFQEQKLRNEQLSQRAKTLAKLLETSSVLAADLPLEQALEAVAYGIQESTPFETVLVSIVDAETMMQKRVCGVGIPLETLQLLKSHQQAWSSVEQLLRPEFKVGQGYLIPHDQRPVVSSDVQIVPIWQREGGEAPDSWHRDDALLYPIRDSEGNPIGLISLDAPRDGKRPSRLTLETIEIFVAQAALIIQNKQRLAAYKNQVERLATSLERHQQLLAFSQGHLPALLHKDLEQMVAIHRLEQRARRIRAGLEITEAVTRQVDVPSVLRALGREMLTRLEMTVSLVAENTLEGPRLVQVAGTIPRGVNPEALFGQRNPLRHVLQTGETLLVMNLDQDDTWRDVSLLNSLHAKAFIALPVFLNNQPIAGALVISNEPLPPLTEADRQVYEQISRQVSIILQDISLLTETRRRLREVNTLLEFSNELSALDADSMLKVLLENALKVVTTAHAGIAFIWDEATGFLVPRAVRGYADVESMQQITYAAGESLPGRVLMERRPLRIDEVNFSRDYTLSAEGLLRYREATAGRLPVSSIIVPIQTGENILGVLLLDNFNQTAAFSREDETLLLSLGQQVALALENVRLMQASQERAAQLQALTLASAAMAANLKTSELVATLLDRLYGLLPYDTAILWLREEDRMRVVSARGFADNEERVGLTINIEDSLLLAEMKRTSQAIVVGDVRQDPRFPSLVEAERLSWLGLPLVAKGELIGVIALEKAEPNYFGQELIQLAHTFASQAAVALENASLYEESVQRAAELDERSQRLARLNLFSSSLSGILNENEILRLTASELQRALAAIKIMMVVLERRDSPVLRFVLDGFVEREETLPLPNAPIFERLIESLGVFTTENALREPDLEPLFDLLGNTTSLLVVPLVSGAQLRALAFVHLSAGRRCSPSEIEQALTIANQAAIALESARLYQATVSRAEQMAILNRASYEMSASLDPEEIYRSIHRAVSELMPVESFVISLLDEDRNEIEGVYLVDPDGRIPNQRIPLGEGLSGRVIQSGEPLLIADTLKQKSEGRIFGRGDSRSILAVPIKISGKTIGMLSAQSYQPNAYDEDDLQILSTLANQAAVVIQNGRLFAETRRLAEELEQRVIERTAELAREQRNTETLLRILTEASSTLDLDRALNRTLALLNDAIGAEQGSILLVDESTNTIHYRAGYGYLTPVMTEGSRPTSFKVGEGLVGWVIQNRQSVCLPDVTKDPRWKTVSFSSGSHRSVVAAPLLVGEEVIGAIMVFHRQVGYFSQEHVNLVQAIGAQVAVAINNARLYELIRDQAERLGAMVRAEQVEASRQQAILEAVADGVLVTDAENRITFLNPSAERILRLRAAKILGQPLEQFVGLFGSAAQAWMTTIRSWSEDPTTYQPGETYAEQIKLEDGRVVLVHLSPVIWRNDFLGTVSIFRDITREVEVDRLKSEFVATVSHELRTPMTSIKGYVDLLLMGAAGALNDNQIHFLEVVRSNTDRLSVLVNDLLDISRIEAGRVTLSFQPVDIREVAEETVADLLHRSQDDNKPMAIMLDASPDLPYAYGDLERIRQIFSNLTDNAYNYTPAGGEIQITIEVVDEMLRVAVRDNGIGIPPENLSRVFERFYRGEDAMVLATPGTGLGLSIVEQLVKMHNGEIWVESEGIPGRGSTFYFTLPIYRSEE